MTILQSVKITTVPGMDIYRLTRSATDAAGCFWPAGMEYRPESAGFDNIENKAYQTVRFLADQPGTGQEGSLATFYAE